jgi:hypothetical protein
MHATTMLSCYSSSETTSEHTLHRSNWGKRTDTVQIVHTKRCGCGLLRVFAATHNTAGTHAAQVLAALRPMPNQVQAR